MKLNLLYLIEKIATKRFYKKKKYIIKRNQFSIFHNNFEMINIFLFKFKYIKYIIINI